MEASFNPDASRMVEEAKGGNELLPMAESSANALNAYMELVEPRTFQEAWNHLNLEQCRKWREAIRKEFRTSLAQNQAKYDAKGKKMCQL